MPVDANLIGVWQGATSTIRFAEDGFLYRLGSAPASVSMDGSELTESGKVYVRIYGSGTDIVGVWSHTEASDGFTWVEEINYRDDGTYLGSWTKDGMFDSIFSGYYTFAGGSLAKEERRALVTTGTAGAIDLDYPYDLDEEGTYDFGANGDLTLTVNGTATVFTKVTGPLGIGSDLQNGDPPGA